MRHVFTGFVIAVLWVGCSMVIAKENPFLFSSGAGAMDGTAVVAEAKGFFGERGINGEVKTFRKGQVGFEKYLS